MFLFYYIQVIICQDGPICLTHEFLVDTYNFIWVINKLVLWTGTSQPLFP